MGLLVFDDVGCHGWGLLSECLSYMVSIASNGYSVKRDGRQFASIYRCGEASLEEGSF